eukprot:TRINITY_DN458_c1_g1_i2.p2 TRINITY_DN458_c1_g1~~TRINITY_DN458_c1_g1_i2.p2  ORF type:complete len:355 (+),score=158.27 TRINITY_DN458_c1_g1_i2:1986-3050(+)
MMVKNDSDPYCVVTIGQNKVKSKKKSTTCNPVWDKTFDLPVVNAKHGTIHVEVFDHDTIGDSDSLGTSKIKLSKLKLKPGVEKIQLFKLKGGDLGENVKEAAKQTATKGAGKAAETAAGAKGGGLASKAVGLFTKATSKGKVGEVWNNHGTVCIGFTHYKTEDQVLAPKIIDEFEAEAGNLKIMLYCASRLNAADLFSSDPYFVFNLNDNEETKVQSSVKSNTLHPTYNQCFAIPIVDAKKDVLNVKCFDEDTSSNDSLGTGKLELKKIKLKKNVEQIHLVKLRGGDVGENIKAIVKKEVKEAAADAVMDQAPGGKKKKKKKKKSNNNNEDDDEDDEDDGVSNHGVVCIGLMLT